jgi:uncharacterized sporulation protein YeaH/YhbH (DUF444 family)
MRRASFEAGQSGRGGGGREASDSGAGEDAFTFALTEEEFLDILFDDLELPELVKASPKDATLIEYRRPAIPTTARHPTSTCCAPRATA